MGDANPEDASTCETDPPLAPLHARAWTSPTFSALEWSVIALAQRDEVGSLREPGPVSQAMGALFGPQHSTRLADHHLEALRRAAVLAWHAPGPLAEEEEQAFLAARLTRQQYDLLLASVARGRWENIDDLARFAPRVEAR